MRSSGLLKICNYFWISCCSVVSEERRSTLFTPLRPLRTFDSKCHLNWSHIQEGVLGKRIKLQLPFLCRGGCRGERGTWLILNLKFFITVNNVSVSHSKATVAPSLPFMLQYTLRNTLCSPDGHMVHNENHWFRWHSKQFSSGTQFTDLRAFYFFI